jgi:hypothetical protein
MKRHQKGEAILAMMVVMVIVALWGGHMSMMGHETPAQHADGKGEGNSVQNNALSSAEKKGGTPGYLHSETTN